MTRSLLEFKLRLPRERSSRYRHERNELAHPSNFRFSDLPAVADIELIGRGPLAIFARMRRKVPPKTNPGRGIRCFMCWSVWVAAAVTLYLLWLGTITKEILPLLVQRLQSGSSLSERLNASINSSGRGILPIGSVGIVMGPE